MKSFFLVLVLLLIAVQVQAFSKIGMRAYSSATTVSCSLVGGTQAVNNRLELLESFNPVISTARTYNLGTKGFANYSATGLSAKQVKIYCYSTLAPSTPQVIKMFFDGLETQTFPLSDMFLFVSQ
jgi:hypothetical protein